MIDKMSRDDLEMEILKNDSLYERFDEERLLSQAYSNEELIETIGAWIIDGDECGSK